MARKCWHGPSAEQLYQIFDRLDHELGIGVASHQLSVEIVLRYGRCIVGRVIFGPKLTSNGLALLTSSLDDTWDEVLNGQTKDLPPTPLIVSQQAWLKLLAALNENSSCHSPLISLAEKYDNRREFTVRPGFLGNGS